MDDDVYHSILYFYADYSPFPLNTFSRNDIDFLDLK